MCSRLPHLQRRSSSSTWGALGVVEGGCYGAQEAKPGVGLLRCCLQGDRISCHPALDLLHSPRTGAIS